MVLTPVTVVAVGEECHTGVYAGDLLRRYMLRHTEQEFARSDGEQVHGTHCEAVAPRGIHARFLGTLRVRRHGVAGNETITRRDLAVSILRTLVLILLH